MRSSTTTQWMAASLAMALVIAFIAGAAAPAHEKLGMALRATARWSFVLFWLASAAGALASLCGSTFQPLARRGRDLGLAFASAHLVHVGLVAWLYHISVAPLLPRSQVIFFGMGVFWTYLLAALSFMHLPARVDPRLGRGLRMFGVEYIALIFIFDFAQRTFQDGIANLLLYLPFLALAVAGPLLRLAAAAKRLRQARTLTATPARSVADRPSGT
jgi:hypothetical protein